MAQNAFLEGLRSQITKSLYGRRLGLTPGNASDTTAAFLAGPAAFREPVLGWNTSGTTLTSTSVATPLPAYGVSVVGASGASATTAYNLAAPIPGVRKTIFCPTTGYAVIGTTDAGAFVCSTGSVTSTYGYMTFAGKGSAVDLIGLTTALWGVVGLQQISTGGAGVTFV